MIKNHSTHKSFINNSKINKRKVKLLSLPPHHSCFKQLCIVFFENIEKLFLIPKSSVHFIFDNLSEYWKMM